MNKKLGTRRRGTVCLVLGLLLLAAALSLTAYNLWEGNRADQAAQSMSEQLRKEIEKAQKSIVPDAQMPSLEIDGNQCVGLLEIPSLDISLPIIEDWDYDKLKLSPCRYSGSYFTDDLVIAGHNYIRHFGPLRRIQPGSDVYFTNVKGKVWHYTVDNIETLQPGQIGEMTDSDSDLTLFTCTLGGQSRCTVRCVKAE